MAEETPKKKPRRKRRTKAQIEADKAAELAAKEAAASPIVEPEPVPTEPDPEDPKEPTVEVALDESWQKTDDVITEMFEESVTEVSSDVKEEPVESVKPTLTDLEGDVDYMDYTPATYANPNMERIANRFKHRRAVRRARLANE